MKKRYCAILIILVFVLFANSGCKKKSDDEETLNVTVGENCAGYFIGIDDPYYQYQWHLSNTGQTGGTAGNDINVEEVWQSGITGCGVVIAVVDDGMDNNHEDLKDNVIQDLNYNYVSPKSKDVSGLDYDDCNYGSGCHGTSVAGVAAARMGNNIGVRGVAGDANLAGYNLLWKYTSQNQYDAMKRNIDYVDISVNSWGPEDSIGQIEAADDLWISGVEEGLANGRDGKGIVYVWAAGNGGEVDYSFPYKVDNSNYDGYANYYGVIPVNAIGDDGVLAAYAENGANIWVSTYSIGNFGDTGIVTTDITGDLGYGMYIDSSTGYINNYTDSFGGTSATAPVAAGVVALMLQANPELGWRDVKLVLAQTALKNDPTDTDWTTNGVGMQINHKYGFGSIDALAAVNLAKTWTPVSKMLTHETAGSTIDSAIPDSNTTGISDTMTVSGSGINKLEYVTINVNLTHQNSGDLEITLTSPSGTVSKLSELHVTYSGYSKSAGTYFQDGNTFPFGTARCLDEPADGTWTIQVKDLQNNTVYGTNTGTFHSWNMKFYGRSE